MPSGVFERVGRSAPTLRGILPDMLIELDFDRETLPNRQESRDRKSLVGKRMGHVGSAESDFYKRYK